MSKMCAPRTYRQQHDHHPERRCHAVERADDGLLGIGSAESSSR